MTCTITGAAENRTHPAKDLIFKYNDKTIDRSLVAVINATTAQYLITDKVPEKIFFKVECCYKNCLSKSDSVMVKSFGKSISCISVYLNCFRRKHPGIVTAMLSSALVSASALCKNLTFHNNSLQFEL